MYCVQTLKRKYVFFKCCKTRRKHLSTSNIYACSFYNIMTLTKMFWHRWMQKDGWIRHSQHSNYNTIFLWTSWLHLFLRCRSNQTPKTHYGGANFMCFFLKSIHNISNYINILPYFSLPTKMCRKKEILAAFYTPFLHGQTSGCIY